MNVLRALAVLALVLVASGCSAGGGSAGGGSAGRTSGPSTHPSPEPEAYRRLVDRGTEQLRLKTAAHDQLWQIGDAAAWSVDQRAGTIRFDAPNGTSAVAPVQIIGTYDTNQGTWLWSWSNTSVEPALALDARRLLEFGQQHNVPDLLVRKVRCDEDHCWTFTAAAAALGNAQGAYRGPAGDALVFMTFGAVQLESRP